MALHCRWLTALAAALLMCFLAACAQAATPADYDQTRPQALEADHLYAESAVLIDADTGEVLFSKNSRVRMYPASTTKIMTLLLGLESGISLDEQVTIPQEAAQITGDSSKVPVYPGDEMTFRDLLYGFMLKSGNDGANAVAMLVSGSIDGFVALMNARAEEIGCVGTHFANAHGLHDEGHYTTAQDLALITRTAMQNETFADIVGTASYDMTIRRSGQTSQYTAVSSNSLLLSGQKYYYPDCNGVKTGYTGKAGYCFVGSAERDGVRLISVVMNCPQESEKWYDTARLFEYGFTRYAACDFESLYAAAQARVGIVQIENAAADDAYGGRLSLALSEVSDPAYTRMVCAGSEASMDFAAADFAERTQISFIRDLVAPIAAGEAVANLTYTDREGTQVTAVLTASRDVAAQPETDEAGPAPSGGDSGQTGGGVTEARRGGADGLIMLLLAAFALLLLLAFTAMAVGRARRKRRRREMEARRREQFRRQHMNRMPPGRPNGPGYRRYDGRGR